MSRREQLRSFTLARGGDVELTLLNYGARIRALRIRRDARWLDLVLGYPEDGDYLEDPYYLGAVIGRFCNRIHAGGFRIGDTGFSTPVNEPEYGNTLHGGATGFDTRIWECTKHAQDHVEFSLCSPDSDQGFPGRLDVTARYSLLDEYRLLFEVAASSDRDTIVNLCNHAYFNLNGCRQDMPGSVANHELQVNAERYLPLTSDMVPTGELAAVSGTPFDLRTPRPIAAVLAEEHPQISLVRGIDHDFLLPPRSGEAPVFAARARSPETDIGLSVATTQPVVHVYSGNFLDRPFSRHAGVCFETQGYTDSPNHRSFPSALLRAGQRYSQRTLYEFDVPA